MRKHLLYFALKYQGNFEKMVEAIRNKEFVPIEEIKEVESKIKSKYVTLIDHDYPQSLKQLIKPPIVLFYYGNLNLLSNNNILAIVGARKCSEYGIEATTNLVKDLKKYNPTIVSGLAEGLDRVAHEEALNNGLATIAVLGFGIDYSFYPKSNKDIYERIKKEGLVISEYPNTTKPEPSNFLFRNRIIAGLSNGVIVTEAKYKSGTMNTVAQALDQGKDIYAIPYPYNCNSGCNYLIKEGAKLIENAKDIYE